MASFEKISKANTTFNLNLLKKISEDEKTSNIFLSPLSISAALSMLMLGTGGNTLKQMSEVLCFTEADNPDGSMQTLMQEQSQMRSQMLTRLQMRTQIQQSSRLPHYLLKCMKPDSSADVIHEDFSKLLKELQKISSLKLTNRLYGDKSFEILPGFLKETGEKYGAELESVDFKGAAEDARININGWVEKNTESKIKDLLAKGTVDASTVLVLVDAIYFKDKWLQQFNKDDTVEAPFRINKNDTKTVKMMRQTGQFNSTQIADQHFQLLEMLYEGEELSMIILLPDDVEDDTTGLEKLEKDLTYDKLMDWMKLMTKYEVQVQLPQFKLEQTYQMNDILTSMGMVDAFDVSKSNFCRMSTATNLVVSEVVHKAFVEVNEEGTEAAAATGVVVSERSIVIPRVFNADHPFLFFIIHKASMSVLFAGRYCNPDVMGGVLMRYWKATKIILSHTGTMATLEKLAEANAAFCLNLVRMLSEGDASNVFFSPFSISAALSMVMLGARGSTQTQISQVLCFTEAERTDPDQQHGLMQSQTLMQTQVPNVVDSSDEAIHEDFSKMLKQLQEILSVHFASRLYGERSFGFLEGFLKETKDKYGAELEPVDFKTAAEGVRLAINEWVEKNTADKIKNLLPEGSVDSSTALVLVNAIHFKDKWLHQFDKEDTLQAPFRMSKGKKMTVPMMHQKRKHRYLHNQESKIKMLEMSYKDERLSMIILLPDDVDGGLEKVEKELTFKKLMGWIGSMSLREVDVKLPKFKLENMYDMNDILMKMGMVDAFNLSNSNFTGISSAFNLVLSKVVHKAFVEVNEEGTEAAAATGVMFTTTAFEMPLFFHADRPFLFFIFHKPTMSILFAGRYCNPE
ncbi:uncharacterized protein LOC128755980 [Synchiropus splendidus]|uniref:uncharacterized protein LOC128755980 n=1 Tax=Synchiropus splendidus TaxID=270530 RepID=UPI00237DC340|nr:uncharacterized protein LOC128755980 [Synchiropus splendidus]